MAVAVAVAAEAVAGSLTGLFDSHGRVSAVAIFPLHHEPVIGVGPFLRSILPEPECQPRCTLNSARHALDHAVRRNRSGKTPRINVWKRKAYRVVVNVEVS